MAAAAISSLNLRSLIGSDAGVDALPVADSYSRESEQSWSQLFLQWLQDSCPEGWKAFLSVWCQCGIGFQAKEVADAMAARKQPRLRYGVPFQGTGTQTLRAAQPQCVRLGGSFPPARHGHACRRWLE